jgi:hypothetical protein
MPSVPDQHWLTPRRLIAYPRIFLPVYALLAIGWVMMSVDLVDPKGKPLGYDFITFWAASLLALAGDAAAAYDVQRIFAAEQAAVPASQTLFLWHYPPMFHLVVLPLALLPYLVSYGVFMLTTLSACAAVVRKLAPRKETLWLLLAAPATFINLFHGQNGFLTAMLFGLGALLLTKRPFLAGLVLGLMVYKPQLGVLVPLALICGRQWTALGAATTSAVLFTGISTAVIGVEAWEAFVRNLPLVREVLETGALPWAKIPSLFISLRVIGVPQTIAYALHIVLALTTVATVAYVWWRQVSARLGVAVVVVGATLVPPYLFDYDLAILAVPLAILAMDGVGRGWRPYEREVLVAAWLTPLVAPILSEATHIPLASIALVAMFAVSVRRALAAAPAPIKVQTFALPSR